MTPIEVQRAFESAGLPLRISKDPLMPTLHAPGGDIAARQTVQIDIRREQKGGRRVEFFIMFFPAKMGEIGAEVQVLGKDASRRQLVLMIKEKGRKFGVVLNPSMARRVNKKAVKVLREFSDGSLEVEQVVRAGTRKFLVGVDERQLFMAQCNSSVTTVEDAHAALKPRSVQFAGLQGRDVRRQGEYFFVAQNSVEQKILNEIVKKHPAWKETKQTLNTYFGLGGNTHTCDELLALDRKEVVAAGLSVDRALYDNTRREKIVYMRGNVKHSGKEHETLNFPTWRLVVLNSETRDNGELARLGLSWID